MSYITSFLYTPFISDFNSQITAMKIIFTYHEIEFCNYDLIEKLHY